MSSGSFGDAMRIVGFIQVLSARSGAPWWSSYSFGFVGFTGFWIHSGSFGSFRCDLRIVVFIWFVGFVGKHPVGRKFSWVSLGRALWVVGFI